MCVTNTTSRRPQPVSFQQSQVSVCQSSLPQQRLLGSNFVNASSSASQQQAASFSAAPISSQNNQSSHNCSPLMDGPPEKLRPKRRRKPQKPGKTAKNNERHFVVHQYHDHALDQEGHDQHEDTTSDDHTHRRGGVSVAFPIKLHEVLDQVEADGLDHVISWQPHGRCFVIHKPKEFVDHVMPKYFRQSKLTSFQRQLNLYGYNRVTRGNDAGGYYHELFLRGKVFLCKQMNRTKVKGTRFKAASSPEQEPDFYSMPTVSPYHSDGSLQSNGSVTAQPETYSSQLNAGSSVFNIEPLPLQYVAYPPSMAHLHQQAPSMLQYFPTAAGAQVVPYSISNVVGPPPPDADGVLDEAVDELFLNQEVTEDTLADFCMDWDPSTSDSGFGISLNDDMQLGYMLEKLLAD